jgi:hypothetical protein
LSLRVQHRNGSSDHTREAERNMYSDDPEKNRIGRGRFYPQYNRRATHQRTAYSIPLPNLLLTAASGLHGRAQHGPVRTKDAAIAQLWFKPLATSLAVVEVLTGIRRHPLRCLMSTLRTGDRRGFDHGTGLWASVASALCHPGSFEHQCLPHRIRFAPCLRAAANQDEPFELGQ